jgi:hypothetical protein
MAWLVGVTLGSGSFVVRLVGGFGFVRGGPVAGDVR